MKITKIVLSTVALVGLAVSLSASSSAEVLFDTKCTMCHSKTIPTDMNNMVAPAIQGVMRHVKMVYQNKDDAVNFMVDYVLHPKKEKSVCMPQKMARFGLMPSQEGAITKEELTKVSAWLYDNYPKRGFVGRGMMRNRPSFAMFDLNGDGVVTKSEHTQLREARQNQRAAQGMPMRNASKAPSFESLDLNKDGKLTQDEFNSFRKNRMGMK
ncbi:MAG: EF-hand domain-containing protein [Sulfurimonas sp.]|nr:EF-hand domain-containing protein [Sulfurimonas sp.]MDQ7068455.1 EF-hand domain-containing protein [Sulfurimonas sp.]